MEPVLFSFFFFFFSEPPCFSPKNLLSIFVILSALVQLMMYISGIK